MSPDRDRVPAVGGLARVALLAWALLGAFAAVDSGSSQTLACKPCAGIRVEDPRTLISELETSPHLEEEAILFVAWDAPLDGTAREGLSSALTDTDAIPWLRLRFSAPTPLRENLERLEAELEEASRIAAQAGNRAHFQVVWDVEGSVWSEQRLLDYAFLIKRAAVAVTGAQVDAQVISQPLPPDPTVLAGLYAEEIAAYLEGVALQPAPEDQIRQATDLLMELDPGTPVILDGLPYPESAWESAAIAAAQAAQGIAVAMFDATTQSSPQILPLKLVANEFHGDIYFDPYSTPSTDENVQAWTFVRGEDLGLRVIVQSPATSPEVALTFSDAQLRNPERVQASGEVLSMFGGIRESMGYRLQFKPEEPVTLLRLERPGADEIEGISGLEEEVTVVSSRQLPVEEILRRLQAREDAQRRKLRTYQAVNTTHLRFQFGSEGVEVTFEGELFYREGTGYDWAWERFKLQGLRWKGRDFPKVPLIEPERAANMPIEILFRPDYRYELRGTAVVEDRDCWVVDFRPLGLQEGESLFRGTVWIDRELFVRVRSRAVQLGLQGEVISNEETTFFTPVDDQGQPTDWVEGQNWLPLRVTSQQIWSLFNGSLLVEKETLLSEVSLNNPDFEARRQELLASDYTMVRDTAEGLRYLVPDKQTGERVVKEKLSSNRVLLGGGVFYDRSLDYPLPLVGVDYFSLDFLGSGSQVNVFFAGALVTASWADPELLGSKFDAGADFFGLAIRGSDTLYRDDQEVPAEEIDQRSLNTLFNIGHPVGKFGKATLTYRLEHQDFAPSDNTAEEFILPVDHFTHTARLGLSYTRFGYRLRVNGSYNKRSDWQPWGLPDSGDYDPSHEDYLRWQAALSKTFYFQKFRRVGIEFQYADGQDLDRFSKYELGFFSDVRVRGYESNRIRADRAYSSTLSYGLEIGELFRIQGLGDVAWVTDDDNDLENEFAAGVGVAGTVIGPWQTIIRLDLGKAVAGPDDGYAVFLAFLKLF